MSRGSQSEEGRDELLDHEADGIREFDNALPRWWLFGFYLSIAFGVLYMVNYHVLPRPLIGRAGMVAEYEAEVEAAGRTGGGPGTSTSTGLSLLTDPDSLAKGKAIFEGPENACFSCHRADLGGLVGPNLTDDYWLYGCAFDDVAKSIATGYPLKGMLPYGIGKKMTDEQVQQVASYILSAHGSGPVDPKPIDPERDTRCRQDGP